MLGALAISVMALVAINNARKGAHPDRFHQKRPELPPNQQVRILVHAINDDRCVGCDACVAVCPTNVLDLINNKSRVIRFQDCIQCEQCMWACPTEALVMHAEGTEPPRLKMPEIDENFETGVPGQYLIGEVAGKPLVKNAANLGRAVVEHMLKEGGMQPGAAGGEVYDVAIVGSGPGGLSAALTCIRHGLKYVVLEKEQLIASTVSRYPKGKWVMAEPYDVRNLSFLPVFDSSKEQMVPIWQEVVDGIGVNIKKGEPVEAVEKAGDGLFDLRTTVAAYRAQRVVLAIGTRGKPRTLGVPGENLPKVVSLLEDPDDHRGKAVLVVGGGDSALEAAMALADAGARVILSYRGRSFNRAQKKNQAAIESYDAQKRIKVLYQSNVVQFTDDTVTIKLHDGQQKSYPNEAAFMLIGAEPPVKWLSKVGVHVVERPHSFSLGKTDEMVLRLVGEGAVVDCPEEAQMAIHLAREGRLPEAMQQQAEQAAANKTMIFGMQPVTGPRGWLKSAKTMFTQALRLDQPMPLSEFAKRGTQRTHSGHGRRDALSASERTRVLRMLRDEGGRLADEDTKMIRVGDVAPHLVPPPAQPPPNPAHSQHGAPARQKATVFSHGGAQAQHSAPPAQQAGHNDATILAGNAPPASPRQPPLPAQSYAGQHQIQQQASQQQASRQQASRPQVSPSLGRTHLSHGNANLEPREFDDEPTRQVDGDEALSALLAEAGQTTPIPAEDTAATQAMPYGDPFTAGGMDEPTRIGHMGEPGLRAGRPAPTVPDGLDGPTRAVDPYAALHASGTKPGYESAPTQAIDLNDMGRYYHQQQQQQQQQPSVHDARTRALNVKKRDDRK